MKKVEIPNDLKLYTEWLGTKKEFNLRSFKQMEPFYKTETIVVLEPLSKTEFNQSIIINKSYTSEMFILYNDSQKNNMVLTLFLN